MRKLFLLSLLTLSAGALLPQPSPAGWGSGGCAPVGATVARAPVYEWRRVNDDEVALYLNGRQIENYRYSDGARAALRSDGTWVPLGGKKTKDCPCVKCECSPCECQKNVTLFLTGVEADKLPKDGTPRHYRGGQKVTRSECADALQLPDDSGKPFVTFIGENREGIEKAFRASTLAQKCRVKSYPADHWSVTGGFVTTGTPTVYVQNAAGEVLYRTDTDPGLPKLEAEARKAQPDYDPAKDPDGSSAPFDLTSLKKVPVPVWIGAGLLALLLVKKVGH